MISFALFLTTLLIGFLGAVQPGPVNSAVLAAALSDGRRAAVWLAVGGCLPVVFYGFLAFFGKNWFENGFLGSSAFQKMAALALVGIGLFMLFESKKSRSLEPKTRLGTPFFRGFGLAFFNPQLGPFWAFWLVELSLFFKIEGFGDGFSFVAGAAMGNFLLLAAVISAASRWEKWLAERLDFSKIQSIVVGFLAAMGAWQFVFSG